MSCRWRAVFALILVLTLPLRAIAASMLPCCASPVEGPHLAMHAAMDAAMAMPMDEAADVPVTTPAHHDDTHPTFDCCAIAMIALPVEAIAVPRYVPPQALPLRSESVAHFVTDAPDRPPRATSRMV